MNITKFEHACVTLEKNGRSIIIDPGVMTPGTSAIRDVDAILITHEHFDHFDAGRVLAAAAHAPHVVVHTGPGVARQLTSLGDQLHVVEDGDVFMTAGFTVRTISGKHHHTHPDTPPVDNVGFMVDCEVFHPGDALTVVDVPTLLVPAHAPWMSVPDLVNYLREVRPSRAYGIHDGLLNEWGLRWVDGVLEREARRLRADIRRLRAGESVKV